MCQLRQKHQKFCQKIENFAQIWVLLKVFDPKVAKFIGSPSFRVKIFKKIQNLSHFKNFLEPIKWKIFLILNKFETHQREILLQIFRTHQKYFSRNLQI